MYYGLQPEIKLSYLTLLYHWSKVVSKISLM